MEANEGGGDNFTDSTALNGSDSNNGTRGFTTGPDLVDVDVRPSQNQIDYVFDQEVQDVPNNSINCETCLKYIEQDGDDVFSDSATVETASDGRERVVRAQFGGDDVTDGVIAVAEPDAVRSRTWENPPNERFALAIPGTAGDTNDPDLVSAELVSGGDSDLMLFTYNGQIDPRSFEACYAIFSDTSTALAEGILVTGENTLQVEFEESFSDVTELVVGGGDLGGCVQDANSDESSTQGAKPSGGNIGARGARLQHRCRRAGADDQPHQRSGGDQAGPEDRPERDQPRLHPPGRSQRWQHHLADPGDGADTGSRPEPLTLDFGASEIPEGTVGVRFDGDNSADDCEALFTFDYEGTGLNSGTFEDEENVDQVFAP